MSHKHNITSDYKKEKILKSVPSTDSSCVSSASLRKQYREIYESETPIETTVKSSFATWSQTSNARRSSQSESPGSGSSRATSSFDSYELNTKKKSSPSSKVVRVKHKAVILTKDDTANVIEKKSVEAKADVSKKSSGSSPSTPTSKKNGSFKGFLSKKSSKQKKSKSPPLSNDSKPSPGPVRKSGSFHTTASSDTERRKNTALKIDKNNPAGSKSSFLQVIGEDSESVFSGNKSKSIPDSLLGDGIDKEDEEMINDLISECEYSREEEKIFDEMESLQGDQSENMIVKQEPRETLDDSDLLFGDEEIEVQDEEDPTATNAKQSQEDSSERVVGCTADAGFFEKITSFFKPLSQRRDDDVSKRSGLSGSELRDQTPGLDEAGDIPKNSESVLLDIDGIDIISLGPMGGYPLTSEQKLHRTLSTMTPVILIEKIDSSRKRKISNTDSFAFLMEGYEGQSRWYVNIPWKLIENSKLEKQVKEVVNMEQPQQNIPTEDSKDYLRHVLTNHFLKGDFSEAVYTLNRNLLPSMKNRKDFHVVVGASFHNIGNVKLLLGLYDEAKASYLASVRARVRKLGDDHPDVVASLLRFALCLYMRNSLDDAQAIFLRTVEKLYKAKDCKDRVNQIGKVLNNLGCIQFEKGDYVSALKIFQTSLNILSRESASTLCFTLVLCNMSHVFMKRGEVLEASVLLEQAVSIQSNFLEENHELIIDTKKSLSYIESISKNFVKSKKVYDDLIQSLVTKLPGSPEGKFHC